MDLAHTVRNQDFRQEGQTFKGLKWSPPRPEKSTDLNLFFENGPIYQIKCFKNRTSRVPNFQGPKVTPTESKNSLDSTHKFSKKAKSNKVKISSQKNPTWMGTFPFPILYSHSPPLAKPLLHIKMALLDSWDKTHNFCSKINFTAWPKN